MIFDIYYNAIRIESKISFRTFKQVNRYIRKIYKEGKLGYPTAKDVTPRGDGFNQQRLDKL